MKLRSGVIALLLFIFAVTVLGVAQEQGRYGGTLVVASSQTFRGFNPMFDRENYSMYVIDQIFDELITLDPETLKPAPYLADSWEVSKDGKTITWHLHPGVKFHNGEPLTADDVKFTVKSQEVV